MPSRKNRSGAKAPKNGAQGRKLKVCGPEYIRTFRGTLLGREVALICCGESHEDALDLTRRKGIVEPQLGWIDREDLDGASFEAQDATAKQGGLTLAAAKEWAQRLVEKGEATESESEDDDDEESESSDADPSSWFMVFREEGQNRAGKAKGVAWLFQRDRPVEAKKAGDGCGIAGAEVFEWADLDGEARIYNQRRLNGEDIPVEEYDELIASRKEARRQEGFELFDDWLLRQSASHNLHLILEADVPASEVEFHVQADAGMAPPAHECLRCLELDSDTDSEDDEDPDDGTGSFLDYLGRRAQALLPAGVLHRVDPRELGNSDVDTAASENFQKLLNAPLPPDIEAEELRLLDAVLAKPETKESEDEKKLKERPIPVPSWEAYFGAAAELLYYSHEVKADWAPFLASCVRNADNLSRFFDALCFETVPEAVQHLRINDMTRPLTRTRSLAFRPPGEATLFERPGDQGLVPVKAAPLDGYLKARGSDPPRTWVSGLAASLRAADGDSLADDVREWFNDSMTKFLLDVKAGDTEGDYFEAWLREVHPDIFEDIDTSNPQHLVNSEWVQSESTPGKKGRYYLRDITIPTVVEAFKELNTFDPEECKPSSRRLRVLAKIIIDIFNTRLVDLATILSVAKIVVASELNSEVPIVIYVGADHARSAEDFFRQQGFKEIGMVGKEQWEEDEPRPLEMPDYLHDLHKLF